MKPIWIVLHHYASGNSDSMKKQHRDAERARDKRHSYHYTVFSDGSYWMLNDPSRPKGHCGTDHVIYAKNGLTSNFNSIGVSVTGNFHEGHMKEPRKNGVIRLLAKLCIALDIEPENIIKHNQVWSTACPGQYYPYEEIIAGVKNILDKNLIISLDEKVMKYGDKLIYLEKEPTVLWGTTIFPVGELLRVLGFEVSWNGQEKKITATSEIQNICLWFGEKTIEIDGKKSNLAHETLNVWGTNVVPLRSFLEKLGYTINWLDETKQIQAVKY